LTHGEYTMNKSSVQGKARCARWPKKWAAKTKKERYKCEQSTDLGALRSKIRCETKRRRTEYGNLFRGKDLNSGLKSEFSWCVDNLQVPD
jgi:hypothetical protein